MKILALMIGLVLLSFVAQTNANSDVDKQVTIAAANFEPYMGENMPNGGLLVELTLAALERVGYRVELKFYPWVRALANVEAGRCDALLGASYTDARAALLEYPKEKWDVNISFFMQFLISYF